MHRMYKSIIRTNNQNSEEMKDLFLKELLIKDNIIKTTEGAKDKYY